MGLGALIGVAVAAAVGMLVLDFTAGRTPQSRGVRAYVLTDRATILDSGAPRAVLVLAAGEAQARDLAAARTASRRWLDPSIVTAREVADTAPGVWMTQYAP